MGTPSKKERAGEVFLHTVEELQKIALSFIPAGPILDGFLGYWARLKQKRVIDFSESLKKVLEEFAGRELNANDFENEDFMDIMEIVFRMVQSTKSEYKLERYRNILYHEIVSDISHDLSIIFVRLLEEVEEIQLYILVEFNRRNLREIESKDLINTIFGTELASPEQRSIVVNGQMISIAEYELQYHIDNLVAKGLLSKVTKTRDLSKLMPNLASTITGKIPEKSARNIETEHFNITQIGKDFLDYIKNPSGEDDYSS